MKLRLIFGLVISFVASVFALMVFIENYNSIEGRKFYASLVGFLIFLLLIYLAFYI